MPTTPTSTTHARPMSKRAPASALATRSPMSTNPPMAVRMPSVIPKIFFRFIPASLRQALVEALQLVRHIAKGPGDLGQLVELTPAGGDAKLAQDRGRGIGQVVELL